MSVLILQVDRLTKTFVAAGRSITVLDNVSFCVEAGSSLAIVGPSGCGKSTLLGLCAGLDEPTSGSVRLNNVLLNELDEDKRAKIRNYQAGFIFQSFQLIPTLTALENVMVPIELRGESHNVHDKALGLLDKVGLGERVQHYPVQLSGGEQQRVAIARAFVNEPKILFADEPTGNLDSKTGLEIEDQLFDLNRECGTTLVVVTHNNELASRADRILCFDQGAIVSE